MYQEIICLGGRYRECFGVSLGFTVRVFLMLLINDSWKMSPKINLCPTLSMKKLWKDIWKHVHPHLPLPTLLPDHSTV